MSDKFDMQKARAICEKCASRDPYIDHVYWNAWAANVLPAALDRIEELEASISALRSENCIGCVAKHEMIDQQQAIIESLKTAIISDRTELVLYSPDYIVWRYHNDIDKIQSQDDWKPLEVEAKAQLAREYPEIFGDQT